MDRFAVFVDAGYLLAAGGTLCWGTYDRGRLVLDCATAVTALTELGARESGGLPHLRTYWYDGARDAQPTAQHLELARLPGVKLRLGRLVRGRQKGVDSRILRDLIILSQERAMAVAYLVGGDEDLREGVSEAQERGVRVVLVGVEPPTSQNLSPTLSMEADEVQILDKAFVEAFIHLRESPAATIPSAPEMSSSPAAEVDVVALGRAFGLELIVESTPERMNEIRRGRPVIPRDIDKALRRSAAQDLGVGGVPEPARRQLRVGFWEAILAEPGVGSGT